MICIIEVIYIAEIGDLFTRSFPFLCHKLPGHLDSYGAHSVHLEKINSEDRTYIKRFFLKCTSRVLISLL